MAYIEDKDRVDKMTRRYEPKIVRLLTSIGEAFQAQGFMVEGPFEHHDEEPTWELSVYPPVAESGVRTSGDPDLVDVSIHIALSEHRDGEKGGMSFLLDTAHYGGAIIGGFAPFNFTDQVWVPRNDRDEVEDRWEIFVNGINPHAVVESVKNFYQRRKK